jgi:hypothetical protein
MSSDPDEFARADKLNRAEYERAVRDAAVCVAKALRPLIDVDRKRALDLALEELNSGLAVRHGG